MTGLLQPPPKSGTMHGLVAVILGCRRRLSRMLRDANARAELRQEFANLEQAGVLDTVLSDMGLSRLEMPTIVENHPGARRRLAGMLRRLGIRTTKAVRGGVEMRAIQQACLLCEAGGRCERWLRGSSHDDPRRFCPNAEAFDDLDAVKHG